MARVLNVELSEMQEIDKRSKNPVTVSSTCTVFAESEVISQLSKGAPIEDTGKKLGMDIDGGQRGVAERPDHQRVEQVDGCRGRRLNHDRIGDPPKGGYILSCFGAEARRQRYHVVKHT